MCSLHQQKTFPLKSSGSLDSFNLLMLHPTIPYLQKINRLYHLRRAQFSFIQVVDWKTRWKQKVKYRQQKVNNNTFHCFSRTIRKALVDKPEKQKEENNVMEFLISTPRLRKLCRWWRFFTSSLKSLRNRIPRSLRSLKYEYFYLSFKFVPCNLV